MSLFDMTASTNVRKLMVLNSEFPKDLEVINSDTATFVADISEHGRPAEYTYQWYVNEEMVNDATTAVYSRDTTADKGVYSVHCVITNKAGSVKTRTATLTVNALPKLDSSKIVNATIAIGEPKNYSVSISEHGYPETYSYQWYQDGVKISGATSSSYSYSPSSGGNHTLYCEVTNTAGTVKSKTATIKTRLYLYKQGKPWSNVTGGWAKNTFMSDYSSYSWSSPTNTIISTNNTLTISVETYGSNVMGGAHTVKNFDLTKFTKLTAVITDPTTNYYIGMYLVTKLANDFSTSIKLGIGGTGTKNLDISKVSGKYYAVIEITNGSAIDDASISFSEIYLS